MSAICGLVLPLRPDDLTASLRRMAAASAARADPGAQRTYEFAGGGFARQAVLDANAYDGDGRGAGQAPGLTLVCAAELYNAAALRQQCRGTLPPDAGEAAIIAALYRRHGLACVRQLQGAFAFALWDADAERLLLATDAFAIQPLHYYCGDAGIAFGSRLAAVLQAPGTPRDVDLQAVLHYVYFSVVPTPHTIYRGISKLPPGHYLTFSRAGCRLERYWDMAYSDAPAQLADCATAIRRELAAAVRSQATYDGRPERVGAFLSGGTDSSTISGLLGQALQRPARTFSIGFAEEGFDETGYARTAARHFGTEHHEYVVTAEDAVAFLPLLAQAYDEPFGNASAIGAYHCARLAREAGVDTLLAGDGGDELFAGNTRYVTNAVFEIYHRVPAWLRARCLEPGLARLPVRLPLIAKAQKYVRRAALPQPYRYFSYNLLYELDVRAMFTAAFLDAVDVQAPLALAADHYGRVGTTSTLHRLLYLDLKLAITDNDLRKVTRMGELAGVRVRYPMLDRALVELSGRIPAHLKLRRFRERYVFKEAFREWLPPTILNKKKQGFGVPVSRWLRRAPLHDLARDTLLSAPALRRGYFERAFIEELFVRHRDDRTNFFGDAVWVLLMLELWHRAHE